MSDWQRKLCIGDVWDIDHTDMEEVRALAGIIAERLGHLRPFPQHEDVNEEREEIAANFRAFARDGDDLDEFNSIMASLYDWGDIPLDSRFGGKKVCWIDWLSKAAPV